MEATDFLTVHHLGELETASLDLLTGLLDRRIRLTSGGQLADPADYQVLIAGRPELQHLNASPILRMVVIPFAGIPPETRRLLLDFPEIAVYNLHHNADLTAELAMALLLAAAKRIVPYDRALRRGDWSPRYQPTQAVGLAGKTALILGFGAIGQRIGRGCQALGMHILAIRRRAEEPLSLDYPAAIYPPKTLQSLLPQAQVLIVALPSTPETDGLLGENELRLMPPGGLLVNVARGAVVKQAALYQALGEGHLHAAGLDVWYHYPTSPEAREHTPPADYPFDELDNVVLSPHRGGLAIETETLRMQALADLLNAVCRGEPIPNQVDVAAGY